MAQPITQNDLNNNQQQSSLNPNQNQQGQQTIQTYQPNKKQMQGTGFTNMNKYLNANKSNQLGNAVGNNIQQTGQNAQQNTQQSVQGFQQNLQNNNANNQQNQQVAQQAFQDPTQMNNNQVQQFQNLLGGQYQGPTGLQNASDIQAQTQDATNAANATSSEAGRQGLLQRTLGNQGQYTSGQQRLDNSLLGATGAQQLAQARLANRGIAANANQQMNAAQEQGKEMAGVAQQVGNKLQSQFGENLSNINTNLSDQATQAQGARDVAAKQIQDALASGKINQKQADLLGLQAGQRLYGLKASDFVKENDLKATGQNVASQADYAKLDALRRLGGNSTPQAASQILGQFANQNQQAQAFQNAGDVVADKDYFQQQLNARQGDYNARAGAAQNRLKDAQQISQWAHEAANAGMFGGMTPAAQQLQARGLMHGDSFGRISEWADKDNLAKAQGFYNDVFNQLNSQYGAGGGQQIEITPEEQAAIDAQNNGGQS